MKGSRQPQSKPQHAIFSNIMTPPSTTTPAGAPAGLMYRHITRIPGVRGGNAILEGTRVGVHDVIGLLQNGETIDTITVQCFPRITHAQVYKCLAYYEDHRDEIDELVARQMAADL